MGDDSLPESTILMIVVIISLFLLLLLSLWSSLVHRNSYDSRLGEDAKMKLDCAVIGPTKLKTSAIIKAYINLVTRRRR